jgi:hypothetical protein
VIEVLAAIIYLLAIPISLTTCAGCGDVTDQGVLRIFKDVNESIASFLTFPISWWECPDYVSNWATFVVGATLMILSSASLARCAINMWDCYTHHEYERALTFTFPVFFVMVLVSTAPVWS